MDSAARALHLDHITNQLFAGSPSASFKQAINQCIQYATDNCNPVVSDVKSLIPTDVDSFLCHYRSNIAHNDRLQFTLTHEAEKQRFRALRDVFSSSDYHSARLLATTANGAFVESCSSC